MAETNVERLERERRQKEQELQVEKSMFSYDKLEAISSYKKETIAIMHKTVAKNTTPAELAYFLTVAKSSGLNPINKEIWCYKDTQGNLIVFTGRDGFLKRNKDNPLYRGMRSSDVCEFDEFEIDMIEGTVHHKITNNRGKVIGAYAIVSIEGQKDTIVYLDFDEFNLNQAKWKTAPKMMIKKCAQSAALREAAGITGIQSEEAFAIKDGIAVTQDAEYTEDKKNPEGERLMLLIQNAKDVKGLEKLFKDCKTPEEISAYDIKMIELQNNK